MSDNGEIEVASGFNQVLPKDVIAEVGSIKLFNKWVSLCASQCDKNSSFATQYLTTLQAYDEVEVRDISLT